MSDNLRIGQTQKQIEHDNLEKMRNSLIEGRLDDIQRFERFNELDLIGKEEESLGKFGGYWGKKFMKKHTKLMKKNAPVSMNNRRKLVKSILYFIGFVFVTKQCKNFIMAFTFDEGSMLWAFVKIVFGILLFFLLPKFYFYQRLLKYNYPDGLLGEAMDVTSKYDRKSFIKRQKEKIDDIKRNDDTVYNDIGRYVNPRYYKALRQRPLIQRHARRMGFEMANKMKLWNDNENRNRGGRYLAEAYVDKDENIYFTASQPPASLTMKELKVKANELKDEYGVEIVRDGRKMENKVIDDIEYNNVVVTERDNNFFMNKDYTVVMMKKNPLRKGFTVKSANEIKVENDGNGVKVYNAINIDNKVIPTHLFDFSGVLIGGLPGAGKSAYLITLCSALIEKDLIDLTILDLKGDSTDWDNFKDLATILQYEKNPKTGESNLQEIYDKMVEFSDEVDSRFREFSKETGKSSFWKVPVTSENKIKMLVIDECQEAFDKTGKSKEEEKIIDKMEEIGMYIVKKQRSKGGIAVFATQRPDSNSVPTSIRSNCSMRVSFRLSEKTVETMTLGTPADDEIISATDIAPTGMQGTAVISNGTDGKREMIRYAYIDGDDLKTDMDKIVAERGSIHQKQKEEAEMKRKEEEARKEKLREQMRKAKEKQSAQ